MSNSNLNWGRLFAQDRVKLPGVPWSNEELNAIYKLKIPAKFVRKGILTIEDYDKARKEGEENSALLPIDESKEQLITRAKELGIDATSDVREDDLVRLIEEAQKKLDEKESEEEVEEKIEEVVKEEKPEVKKVKKNKK